MSLATLRDALPSYASDVAAVLDDLADGRDLSPLELGGCLVACAVAAAEPRTLRAVVQDAGLRPRELEAAKAAAAVTTMNDIYYGAIGGLGNTEYANLPARLSERTLADPGVDEAVFELWCFSVSACNACGPAMDAQERELRRRATPPAKLQTAVRVAAVLGAAARVLAAEAALETDGEDAMDDDAKDGRTPAPERGGEPGDALRQDDPPSPDEVARTPHPAPVPGDVAPG